MKKLLAILTALVMAVSFAVGNVYAVNYDQNILPISGVHTEKIPLYPIVVSGNQVVETQITIPVYALYGYMTQGYYLSLCLPTGMPGTVFDSTEVSLFAKGVEYQLKPMTEPLRYYWEDVEPAVYENKIGFGMLTHGYNEVTGDTVIPASNEFGDYSSLTVVIRRTVSDTYDISKDAELFAEGGDYAFSACMKICSESDGSEVIGSTSYGQNWTVTSKQVDEEATEGFEFASAPYLNQINLAWDHTLSARSIVESAKAIKVVVKLSEPLNGGASYLITNKTDNSDIWWDYALTDYVLDGSTGELVFDIPMEELGDMSEAVGGLNFAIYENITAYNSIFMSDYMHINRKYIEEQGITSPVGKVSWVDGDDRVYYEGKPVNYADGAAADAYGASVRALEAYMEVTVADPVTVNLSALMRDNLENVKSYIQGALPGLRIDEEPDDGDSVFYVYGNSGQSSPDVYFNVRTNPGDFCTDISVSSDKGDLSFLKDHPEVCLIDGIPLGITREELDQRLSNSNVDYYAPYTDTYDGDEQIPAYKYTSYGIYKYFSNGDFTFMTYAFSQLRRVNGQYVLLSDEEYAASAPVSVSISYMDYSRLPDLSYIEDLSLIGKTPEEAQSILDSLCPGLKYEVVSDINGDYFTVGCDTGNMNVMSNTVKDGVISDLYLFTFNPPKNLEGMPSVINQQKLDEMLADKNLSSRVVKNEYDDVVHYSYEFYIDGKTYTYFEDGRAFLNPEYKGTYTLMVQKMDYIPGDVNNDGKVTLEDAILTLKRAMNVGTGSDVFIEQAADVIPDGRISLEDAIEVLKMAMKVAK